MSHMATMEPYLGTGAAHESTGEPSTQLLKHLRSIGVCEASLGKLSGAIASAVHALVDLVTTGSGGGISNDGLKAKLEESTRVMEKLQLYGNSAQTRLQSLLLLLHEAEERLDDSIFRFVARKLNFPGTMPSCQAAWAANWASARSKLNGAVEQLEHLIQAISASHVALSKVCCLPGSAKVSLVKAAKPPAQLQQELALHSLLDSPHVGLIRAAEQLSRRSSSRSWLCIPCSIRPTSA